MMSFREVNSINRGEGDDGEQDTQLLGRAQDILDLHSDVLQRGKQY